MPRDYEDLYDLDNMDDTELRELIEQELAEYPELDPDLIEPVVEDGFVRLEGRVGTEQELQQVEHLLSDVLGLSAYSNGLVVDETVRGLRSEAADEEAVEEAELSGSSAEDAAHTDPEAAHLMEDTVSEQYGTQDVRKAVERGHSYEPPDRPPQEGSRSEENH
jgi:hypothetical protein